MRLVILVLLCFSSTVFAQYTLPEDSVRRSISFTDTLCHISISDGTYWTGYLADSWKIGTSPIRWKLRDWVGATAVLGITAGLYIQDNKIKEWVQRNRKPDTDNFFEVVTYGGNFVVIVSGIGTAYVTGEVIKSETLKQTALLMLESYVIAEGITSAIKFSTHRHRPSSGETHDHWDGPSLRTHNLSFPSGHSTAAFAIATTLSDLYPDKRWLPPVLYTTAGLIALSRINNNDHWASDVFLGGAIGFFTAKTITSLHSRCLTNVSLSPRISHNSFEMQMLCKF